ncbi:hypothetical protein CRE_28770 [Caenorhabditis remanei]|uniref:Uncharacterized protein n=1 Tax=Caenorhabditis remanei TaxID=31234 RepID=E3MJY1_CAERE|nr:hypothetical protein CRE_28770 [Caenorhabditis remanei]
MILIEMANQYRSAPILPKPTNSEALEWVKQKVGDDLRKYFNDGFYGDVTQEIQESRRRFEKECATWHQ